MPTLPQAVAAPTFERVAAARWNEPEVRAPDDASSEGTDVEKRPGTASTDRAWSGIDRFLPAGAIVVAIAVTNIVGMSGSTGVSLVVVWQQLSSPVRIAGVLCPVVAVALCAARYDWSKTRSIVVTLAIVSIAAPFIGVWTIRQGILVTGSVSLSAVAAGLSETMIAVPFASGASLALAISTLPRHPHRRYRTAIIGLSVLATICVLTNAIAMRDLVAAATTGSASLGIAGWLVQIVSP